MGTDLPRPEDLLGAWELVRWRIRYSDGRPDSYPYGEDARGWLLYDRSGRMSATIGRADRPRISQENVRLAPLAEQAAAFDSLFHYGGRWHVDGRRVVHTVDYALNPNFPGTEQVREITLLPPDGLVLSAEATSMSGTTIRHELAWRRVG